MDSDVSLQRNSNRHEDRSGHGDALRRVQQVGEELRVKGAGQTETLAETLKDTSEQVPTVETDESDEEKIKAVSHFISGEEKEERFA